MIGLAFAIRSGLIRPLQVVRLFSTPIRHDSIFWSPWNRLIGELLILSIVIGAYLVYMRNEGRVRRQPAL